NACASILQEGDGEYRLKPVLTAGQGSTNDTGISGKGGDAGTGTPIIGGTALVAVGQQDPSGGAGAVFEDEAPHPPGNFNFCRLPSGNTFDVVAVAINGAGVAYNATVAIGVPNGTHLGNINLFAETGDPQGPATLQGFVTATTGSSGAAIDATVSALQ